ncbi:MAG: AAA family ATPase [Coriobacteriales bacterium]|nr:AAA family ATPase [Coriobacteriales bacterium]
MSVSKIVITGGPCGGKTTALSRIQRDLSHLGYTVLIVPETATALISGGVAPWTCGTNEDYQKCQMLLQLQKERIFEQAAATMDANKILIVCDRGELDNRVYMSDEEFARVLSYLGKSKAELRDSYDAVFHLVTAAKGAEEFYSLENNEARTETAEEAAAMDDKFIAAWTGHPYLRVIDNSCDFEEKMRTLIREITYFLGELEPYEIERKFLVRYPNIAWLESLPNCEKVEIVQHYLRSDPNQEIRIRCRRSGETSLYYLTEKRVVGTRNTMRTQRRLTEGEYSMLLVQSDPKRREIRKTRYCLTYENQYFEIDVFPCWNDQAIAEIELSREDTPVRIPPELEVIREVTGDPKYRNAAIAALPKGATH